LLKRASAIAYDAADAMIIVTDKTGEVYSFPWPLPPSLLDKYQRIKSLPPNDDKNPLTKPTDDRFLGTFLLGHSSSVVACTLAATQWGRALVTVDRDEHVRISVFPQTWIIHAMGLGHTAFVSCVAAVDRGIVTGEGDNRVILWGFDGVLQLQYTISHGSCVRLIRPWKDMIVVVSEEYILCVMRLTVGLRLWRY
jgi:tRNA (guanine-N(7)-)-methyltransferase subunit TRM82